MLFCFYLCSRFRSFFLVSCFNFRLYSVTASDSVLVSVSVSTYLGDLPYWFSSRSLSRHMNMSKTIRHIIIPIKISRLLDGISEIERGDFSKPFHDCDANKEVGV